MKSKSILYISVAALLFIACSSDIEFTEPSNRTGAIQFLVGSVNSPVPDDTEKTVTRGDDHTHEPWNKDHHANTLGVFGIYGGKVSNKIFDNQKVTYNSTTEKWEYDPLKYWTEFAAKTPLDFFGYMMETSEVAPDLPVSATLTPAGSAYTLSFPASISSPILLSPDKHPLICHTPSRIQSGNPITFDMDQTLTAYRLQFQLGEKMDNVRDFIITSVKIYGNNLPTGGTISRTYTFTDGKWTAGQVTWDVTSSSDNVSENLITTYTKVNHTEWKECNTFYIIPTENFTPTIEVTYDVFANDDNNADGSIITRKDVKSTIILNPTNFNDLATGTTGEINPIKIKIVPDYLYVLSDDDQSTGFLVVDK